MSSSALIATFSALLVAALISTGEGIKCWVCSSDVDPRCGDPFNTTQSRYLITDCDRERSHTPYLRTSTAVCRKLTQIVNKERVVVRSCSWGSDSGSDGPCSAGSLHPQTQLESCSVCSQDECNSAPGLALSVAAGLLPPLFVSFMRL